MHSNPAKLTTAEFAAGLAIKVLLGVAYGYIYLHFYNGDDTWRFHKNSIDETALLLNDPSSFFINDITPVHALNEGRGLREIITLYLNDLQYSILVKNLAFLNLVSGGNYFINTALFNVVIFFGHYWLFSTLTQLYPNKRKLFYIACFFYLPAVFWLSGLRIDGILFFFVALFITNLAREQARFRRYLMLFVSYCGILVCRPETAALILPPAIGFLIARLTKKPLLSFAIVYGAFITLFFSSIWWMGAQGLPGKVAERQHLFLALEGTRFNLDRLEGNVASYINVLPQAVANTFIRPFLWEAKGFLQLVAASEVVLFLAVLLYAILRREADWKERLLHPVILFLVCLAVSMYISIGYLVPFPGAIIRYKAIALILLVCVLTVTINLNLDKKKI